MHAVGLHCCRGGCARKASNRCNVWGVHFVFLTAMANRKAVSDEAILLRRCRAGDRDAFGELVRRHEDKAFRVAYRFLNSVEDARDAVQEAFLRAYRSLRSLRGDRFEPWFMKILVNLCTDERRRRSRVVLTGLVGDERAQEATDYDLRSLIRSALARLPARYRQVLILRDVEGYSTRETSEILGLTEVTARVLLLRARRRLAEEMEKLERSGRR